MNIIFKNNCFIIKEDSNNNIVFLNVLKNNFTDLDMDTYESEFLKLYDKFENLKKKFSIIYDISELGLSSISYAKRLAYFLKDLEIRTKKLVYCSTLITSSYSFKKTFNLFIKLLGSPTPTKIVSNLNEAIDFVDSNCDFKLKFK